MKKRTLLVGAALAAGFTYWWKKPKEISFDYTFKTNFSPTVLWTYIEEAFRNSKESELWIQHLEELETTGIAAGNKVRAIYKTPFFAKVHHYYITEASYGKYFVYEPIAEHPLKGRAIVEITPTKRGCNLRWRGKYYFTGMPLAAIYLVGYFEKAFFKGLQENLYKIEPRMPQNMQVIDRIYE